MNSYTTKMKINPTKTIEELTSVLTYIIDTEKNKNIYHAWRVSILAVHFAKDKTSPRKLRHIFYAGLLHDIGGVGFPHHIIHYLKHNSKANKRILLSHPLIGAQLVSGLPQMTAEAKLILDHHEWINGQGYPRAKTEDSIPWGSQVIRLADSIDTALQGKAIYRLNGLKTKLSSNVQREYSKNLFDSAFARLRHDKFFYRIYKRCNIPAIFKETRDSIAPIRIQTKIDAVGTTLEIIAEIIDMKHTYTSGHSSRVSRYAMSIALAMDLEHDQVTLIKWAGLLHDIGKYNISQHILNKPASLTPGEFEEVKKHARIADDILGMLSSLKEAVPIAFNHHEYFDGSGYPLGLAGKKIPLGARILTVCDAFDAMTSNRPYRMPLSAKEACQQIKKLSGKQFDPEIVRQALPIFRNLGM